MSTETEYAIPLFSLIDKKKVDMSQPLPEALGEQLQLFLEQQIGIKLIAADLAVIGEEAYLVLHGVEAESLPALCSLVDVQRTQLFRYERADTDSVTLTPLNVKI